MSLRHLHRFRTPRVTASALLFAAGCASPPSAQSPTPAAAETAAPEPQRSAWPEPAPSGSETMVHAELATSAQALEGGGKFLLAVRFQIPNEYRISWTNPGDVGQSTHVKFEVPEGFVVGPIQFPAPTRFVLPGHLVSYGYEHETAVFAEVTAPEHVAENKPYRFDVKADWFACKKECLTEELGAWLEVLGKRAAPEPQLPAELSAYYAAIPKSFDELPESSHDWKVSHGKPALTLSAADVKWIDFFPGDMEQPKLLGVDSKGQALRIKFAKSSSGPLHGLAVAEIEGKQAFFDVNLPWPE
jgi:DsbC/DsbD-like thiol-disulfide interchange protein